MLYPIFVNLVNKRCVVVGGGKIAEKRVLGLLAASATVDVISPEITDNLKGLTSSGEIVWQQKEYTIADIEQAFLVVAATDSPAVNQQVAKDANAKNLLIGRADQWNGGNYLTGVSVVRGALQLSLTTGGTSPTLAAVLKTQLENMYGEEWERWALLFENMRPALQSIATEPERMAVVKKILLDGPISEHIRASNLAEAEKAARKCI
jgi:precorrin-2 dehydrogenase / sirohydrochlorin ferrochelatase